MLVKLASIWLSLGSLFTPEPPLNKLITQLEKSDAADFQEAFNNAPAIVRSKDTIEQLKDKNECCYKQRQEKLGQFEKEKNKKHNWIGFLRPLVGLAASGMFSFAGYQLFKTDFTEVSYIGSICCMVTAFNFLKQTIQSAKTCWYYQDTLAQQRTFYAHQRNAHIDIRNFLANTKIVREWKDKLDVGPEIYNCSGNNVLPPIELD